MKYKVEWHVWSSYDTLGICVVVLLEKMKILKMMTTLRMPTVSLWHMSYTHKTSPRSQTHADTMWKLNMMYYILQNCRIGKLRGNVTNFFNPSWYFYRKCFYWRAQIDGIFLVLVQFNNLRRTWSTSSTLNSEFLSLSFKCPKCQSVTVAYDVNLENFCFIELV